MFLLNQKRELDLCLRELNKNGIIVYPTDTVYGIGGDATNKEVSSRINRIKKREENQPLIFLMNSIDMVNQYIGDISDLAINELESKDPTTVIFSKVISEKLTGYNSLAIRIPKNQFCKNLINEFGKPLSSTSANTHGSQIPISYEIIEDEIINNVNHVVKYIFPKKVKPSRIVEIKGNSIKIVRS